MSGPRHPVAPERIVGEVILDGRSALIVEQHPSGRIVIWKVNRNPAGRAILASAIRAFGVPLAALGDLAAVLQRIDGAAAQSFDLRRSA